MADAAVFAHDGMRVREEVVADARAAINGHEAVQDGIAAEHRAFVHVAIRTDVRARADLRRGSDHGRGVNRRRVTRRRIEKPDGAREVEIGILGAQERERRQAWLALHRQIARDQHGRRARGAGRLPVTRIRDERQLAACGRLDPRDAVNFGLRIAFKLAA